MLRESGASSAPRRSLSITNVAAGWFARPGRAIAHEAGDDNSNA
jgi:hypothetical protein